MRTEANKAQLEEDIKKLEELAYGTKEEVKKDEESAETTDSKVTEPTAKSTEVETETTVVEPPTPEEVKEERDWESEYKTLRRNSDQYKYVTRSELANLKERLVAANAEIVSLKNSVVATKVDPFKDTFSKEDIETVGEDALSLMKKAATTAAEKETEGIKEELSNVRKARLDAEQKSISSDRAQATQIFLNKLSAIVPEYSDINLDPAFEVYIKGADPVNGGTRLMHFKNAEQSGNVYVVAKYMKDFKAKAEPVDSLAERVTPTGAPVAATVETTEQLIPVSEVDKFYDDVAKNKYKGKMTPQRAQEAKYD